MSSIRSAGTFHLEWDSGTHLQHRVIFRKRPSRNWSCAPPMRSFAFVSARTHRTYLFRSTPRTFCCGPCGSIYPVRSAAKPLHWGPGGLVGTRWNGGDHIALQSWMTLPSDGRLWGAGCSLRLLSGPSLSGFARTVRTFTGPPSSVEAFSEGRTFICTSDGLQGRALPSCQRRKVASSAHRTTTTTTREAGIAVVIAIEEPRPQ